MTTTATRPAPAAFSAAAALWALAPVVHVSSISSTDSPFSRRDGAELLGCEKARGAAVDVRAHEQPRVPVPGGIDDLPTIWRSGWPVISLDVARWDGRHERETATRAALAPRTPRVPTRKRHRTAASSARSRRGGRRRRRRL